MDHHELKPDKSVFVYYRFIKREFWLLIVLIIIQIVLSLTLQSSIV